MSGMNGLEVAARLRDSGSTAAVVFFTVHEDEEFVAAAKAVGGIGYVVKPRLVADLLLAVREARSTAAVRVGDALTDLFPQAPESQRCDTNRGVRRRFEDSARPGAGEPAAR